MTGLPSEVASTPDHMTRLRETYAGRRVLVTGHTGFKGAWLAAWLIRLGADVHGLALAPDDDRPSLYDDAGLQGELSSNIVDIRDAAAVTRIISTVRPEFVFHLAARALVQQGYEDPIATLATNVMGTAHLLEAVRVTACVRSLVCVTTDKVYRNREWPWPYRESDELGGLDAYSASKGSAELVTRAYANALKPAGRELGIATARGGNVLGGGDFSPHRLVPDIMRAVVAGQPLRLRNPNAVRPWQHVLDLCHGYLLLGRALANARSPGHDAVNFGTAGSEGVKVRQVVEAFLQQIESEDHPVIYEPDSRYEAATLKLDSSRAAHWLGWRPHLDPLETLAWTARWYQAHSTRPGAARQLLDADLAAFESLIQDGANA